ncbi:MAG: DUF2490 domain-containing protein [Candidatus Omnitrophica bacterium]|nr:DUF2490 domain-containing protein [Candidatus Omnitrophota bacterium]
MRRKEWVWLVVAAVMLTGSSAWARDDFQTWETVELSKQLGTRWELFFRPEIRIRDDAGELFYHEYRQGVRWKPSQHLQIGMNYLFVRNESSGKPREEHTGELDITPKTTIGPLNLSLRGRLALKAIQGSAGEQEWEFRLMPKVAYPASVAGHKLTPYVADDLFYNDTRDAWNQNRLFVGAVIPVTQACGAKVSVDVYYMLQSLLGARHDWSSNHVVGTQLSVQW